MKAFAVRFCSIAALSTSIALGMSACTTNEAVDPKGPNGTAAAKASAGSTFGTSGTTTATLSPTTTASTPPSEASSSDSGLVKGTVGQTVSNGQYAVKVNAIRDNAKSSYSFETPDAGHRYVDINLTVTNTNTADKLLVDDFGVKPTLTDNTTPTSSIASGVGTPLSSSGLFKGDAVTGDVVFSLPTGVDIKYIDINFNEFSLNGSQVIRISPH